MPLNVQAAEQNEGIKVGRRNPRERGREKEGTHSGKLLDASHKYLAQTPHWDAGQWLPVVS